MDINELHGRWLDLIGSLPRNKTAALEDVLADPQSRRALRKLIEDAVEMYTHARAPNSHREAPDELRDRFGSTHESNLQERLRNSLDRALSDRKIFPTTNDVVGAVNHFFEMDLEPSRFRKSGRRAVLTQLWRRLESFSRRERDSKLRRFFESIDQIDPHRSYRELFRILSRSE